MASNTLPITDRFKIRSISAPSSAETEKMKKSIMEVLKSAVTDQETRTVQPPMTSSSQLTPDAEIELGLELARRSDRVEEELQGNNQSFLQQVYRIVNALLQNENKDEVYELFFVTLESTVKREVNFRTFVNISVFCIVMWRRYKEVSSDNSRSWITEQVVELMTIAYSRYEIDVWIEEMGGWPGVLARVRGAYHSAIDYAMPSNERRGSLIAASAGVAGVAAIAGIGAWWYLSSK